MSTSTGASRTAAALAGLLGLVQLVWAVGLGGPGSTTGALLGPLTLVAAAALARISCLETRLAVVLLSGAQLGLTVLSLTIGLPGQARHAFDLRSLAGLALPLAVLVAIDVDRRLRTRRSRSDGTTDGSPYAR
ncbi:hypothetical protein GUY44_03765 [Pimelobacter simplex]|uniref:Uncharacterized protein n=1 Tax=Nocardioides simplex TaxID=2045 RepID=A0A0A1DPX9_NOCSI|nr:hypothetical protein [Pimelobacter simplex]AIY19424.1 hypothetical protein KR76_26425 [Pimelobacter simplex]MCG8149582.1 hypothetical protein [Pimelobacter simplex]GEB16050.1 hypothetical protein NSI01_43650 [Pimelobacter simplex]SFM81714.1 hypothetical protein SAMN05421671_3466 [Pimelobacter simplex]